MELELVKLIHELVGLDQPQSMSYSGRARLFTGLMRVSIDLMMDGHRRAFYIWNRLQKEHGCLGCKRETKRYKTQY